MGVSMDMTGTQRQILENVVQQHIRPVASLTESLYAE
jgi:hypothetical protein